jgi:hypothetical protein
MDRQAVAEFATTLLSAGLLRATDTADTGHFLRMHQQDSTMFDLTNFIMLCIAFRRFGCVETWDAMRATVWLQRTGPPNWPALSAVLVHLFDSGRRVFGGLYYPATLRKYWADSCWKVVGPMPPAARELLTLQLLWGCLIGAAAPAIAQYEARPSGQTFKHLCVSLMEATRSTTGGCFGEYHLKLLLGLLVCSGRVPSHHMTYWPTQCPGYTAALQRLFPGLPPTSWNAAVQYLYRYMGQHHGGHLNIAEVAMHLCWDKRRRSGALADQGPGAQGSPRADRPPKRAASFGEPTPPGEPAPPGGPAPPGESPVRARRS